VSPEPKQGHDLCSTETRVIHSRGAYTAADLLEQTCQKRSAETTRTGARHGGRLPRRGPSHPVGDDELTLWIQTFDGFRLSNQHR
jgi:hypothetical protein